MLYLFSDFLLHFDEVVLHMNKGKINEMHDVMRSIFWLLFTEKIIAVFAFLGYEYISIDLKITLLLFTPLLQQATTTTHSFSKMKPRQMALA